MELASCQPEPRSPLSEELCGLGSSFQVFYHLVTLAWCLLLFHCEAGGGGGGKGASQNSVALKLYVWSTRHRNPSFLPHWLETGANPGRFTRNLAGGGTHAGLVGDSKGVPVGLHSVSLGSLPVQGF